MRFRHVMVQLISLLSAGLLASFSAMAAGESAKAAELVKTVCAACHGADGNSVITANPKLAGQHPEYIAKQLKNFKGGERSNAVMAGMVASLTAEDIKSLGIYFGSQAAKGGAARTNGPGSPGEKIYRAGIPGSAIPACAACHGPTGAGIPVQFPRLAGQHAEYTAVQMKAFRSGERANAPMMKTIAAKMSDQDIEAVSDYIQGLH